MASIRARQTDRGTVYHVQVRIKGYKHQSKTFHYKRDAKRWANATEVAIREQRDFGGSTPNTHTLAELIDWYVETVLPGKSDERNRKHQLGFWKKELGTYPLTEITIPRLVECREKLAKGITYRHQIRSPGTVNRYMAALSHCFTKGVREKGWLDVNLMRDVDNLREPRGIVRYLSDEERTKLLAVCEETLNAKDNSRYLYPLVVIALTTGARYSEVMNLRWADIKFDERIAIVNKTKNDDYKVLRLTDKALEQLRNLYSKEDNQPTDLIFHGRDRKAPASIRESWEAALKKAGITDFRYHDLRHTTASYLAKSGRSQLEIARVLGHKSLNMTLRYSHLSEAHTAEIVDSLSKDIFGA